MTAFFEQAITRTEQYVGRGNSQFFNPARIDPAPPVTRHVLGWSGFPRNLLDGASETQAHKLAAQLLEGVVGVSAPGRIAGVARRRLGAASRR